MKQMTSLFKDVLDIESMAILEAKEKIQENQIEKLVNIFEDLKQNSGKLVFCGIGKSGLVGKKLAATFSSLGILGISLHPTEAMHGDLGRLFANDALILISNSGNTEELLSLMPFLSVKQKRVIGLLGNLNSPLARHCHLVFDCSINKEACLNNQAPTTSTTLTMAIGDAMAVVYQKFVGLSKESFVSFHPAGFLGKSLRLSVKDVMTSVDGCPVVGLGATLKEAILAMTKLPVGLCAVLGVKGNLEGIIVEGDIRRAFALDDAALKYPVEELMTKSPICVTTDILALKALELMENRVSQISQLPVIENKRFVGVVRLHDILRKGLKTTNHANLSQLSAEKSSHLVAEGH